VETRPEWFGPEAASRRRPGSVVAGSGAEGRGGGRGDRRDYVRMSAGTSTMRIVQKSAERSGSVR
jgi:hypothetical protein